MSKLAPTLEAFFTERLVGQREASPHTVASYRDTWALLLRFAQTRTSKEPSRLDIADLDVGLTSAFLDHLESERHNGAGTRNARRAAIRAFFRYASLRHPEHAALIARVLDVPAKRCERKEVIYLHPDEVDALLQAPHGDTWLGRRDHALLRVALQTGMRASELVGLRNRDVELDGAAYVRCQGKGRKERSTPLDASTVKTLQGWMGERGGAPDDPLFPTQQGARLTRNGLRCVVARHATSAAELCPSLASRHVTPHTLRHTTAMELLRAGVDSAVIALWLGHERVETTDRIYLHGDLSIKERALARTTPPNSKPGRYRPSDQLLAFLGSL